MKITRSKRVGFRTIDVGPDECVMVFHKDGVTYDGPNPQELSKNPKMMEKFLLANPHLMNWFDSVEMVHDRVTNGDGVPWDLADDRN
jgi:hypothetical protein